MSSRSSIRSWGSEPQSRCDACRPPIATPPTVDLHLGDDRVAAGDDVAGRLRERDGGEGAHREGRDSTASPHVAGGSRRRLEVARARTGPGPT